MAKHIILLSGPVASGKTTLAMALVERYGFKLLKTRELIQSRLHVKAERGALQRAGVRLDRETGGQWLADALVRAEASSASDARLIVDSIRIEGQAEAIRAAFGPRVVHIHLDAPETTLSERYGDREPHLKELASYDDVRRNRTERAVNKLAQSADIVIDTHRNSPSDVVTRAAARLGLYGRSVERLVDVLVGGQYGSEGKGHVAAYLAPEYAWLIRVGGPNAGHTVFEMPAPYKFHQLPSGTRCSEAKIILGPGAVISTDRLMKEIGDCELEPTRLSIDPHAIIIEQADLDFEDRTLKRSIASTAQGVGAATSRKILRTAARPPVRLAKDSDVLRPFIHPTLDLLEKAFSAGERIFVEGTQGTGLSLHHGTYPHVTSRETSGSGCLAEAGIAPTRVRRTIMAVRTYPIRVQDPDPDPTSNPNPALHTSGPIGIELTWEVIAERSGIPVEDLIEAERTTTTNRNRRVAEFDWTLLRKASSLNGPTDIALTFADYISIANRALRRNS